VERQIATHGTLQEGRDIEDRGASGAAFFIAERTVFMLVHQTGFRVTKIWGMDILTKP